MAKLKH